MSAMQRVYMGKGLSGVGVLRCMYVHAVLLFLAFSVELQLIPLCAITSHGVKG
jgi:hypothetical protein